MHLAFPPWNIWPLSFPAAGLLIVCLRRSRGAREAAGLAFLERLVFVGLTISYFRGLGGWAHLAIVLPCVWPWVAMGLVFHYVRQRNDEGCALAMIPFLWVLCEWTGGELHFLRNHITSWGTVFAATPALTLAPAWGLYGLSYAAAAASAARWLTTRHRRMHLALAALPLIVYWALPQAKDSPLAGGIGRVATVSLNAPDMKAEDFDDDRIPWTPERRKAFQKHAAQRLGSIHYRARDLQPDLLILPEDSLDVSLEKDPDPEALLEWDIENNGAAIEAYRGLALSLKSAVAVGLTTLRDRHSYNSALIISARGKVTGVRDKLELAAGSEYYPYSRWLPYSKLFKGRPGFVDPDDQYTPADEPFQLIPLGLSRVGTLICLEGQTPSFYSRWKRTGADFLILLSNAQWFRRDPKAYNTQVLNLVRVQAAANALPVFISGKFSDWGYVDAHGRASVLSPDPAALQDHVSVHDFLPSPRRRTLIGLLGEYFVLLSALALPVFLFGRGA